MPISIINKYHLKCNKQKLIDKKNSPIMAIAMVAMLAFGGTYAYFTATSVDAKTGDMSTGKVVLGEIQGVTTLTKSNVVSGDTLLNGTSVTVTNQSTVDTWLFVQVKAKLNNVDVTSYLAQADGSDLTTPEASGLYLSVATGWTEYADGWWGIAAGATATENVVFPVTVTFYSNSESTYDHDATGEKLSEGSQMNKKVELSFQAKSIQKANVANIGAAATALGINAK